MRIRVSLGLVAVTALACGGVAEDRSVEQGGPCKSAVVGEWTGTSRSDHLTIFPDDSFRYTGADGCTDEGIIRCPPAGASSGILQVAVRRLLGRGTCLAIGDYSCAFTVDGDTFSYDCDGGGSLTYARRP